MKNACKRITLICLSIVMMFVTCVNASAYTFESDYIPSEEYSGYETYVEVNVSSSIYATAYITLPGKTLDLHANVWTSIKTNQEYGDYFQSKSLEEENILNLPEGYLKRFTEVTTTGIQMGVSILLHTYGSSDARLSDYEKNSLGEYIYEDIFAEIDAEDSTHNTDNCSICSYLGY